MAVYQRGAGAHVAERVQAEPGSDEEKRLERLVEEAGSGWRRLKGEAAKEAVAGSQGGSDDDPKQPAKSASQAAWVEWAVSQGADRDAVKDAKRDDLVSQYGKD